MATNKHLFAFGSFVLGIVILILDALYTGSYWNRFTFLAVICFLAGLIRLALDSGGDTWEDEEKREREFKSEARYDFESS